MRYFIEVVKNKNGLKGKEQIIDLIHFRGLWAGACSMDVVYKKRCVTVVVVKLKLTRFIY